MALRPPRPPARAEIDRILQRSPWFSRQSKALQSAFVAHGQTVRAEPESWIYDVGEEARGLYGVLTGSVRVLVQTEHVAPSLVAIVGPGAIFGYSGRFVGGRRLVTTIARERSTLFYLPESALEQIARQVPDLWFHLAELSSDQLVVALHTHVIAAHRPPVARVALHLAQWAGDETPPVSMKVRQDELAELAGLSRKTVNAILHDLADAGLIRPGYGRIDILDPKGLRSLLSGAWKK